MPVIKFYGGRLDPALVGRRQVFTMPTSRAASPPIQADRWARNGKHPNAQLVNALDEAANQSALFHTKQIFYWYGTTNPVFPAGTADESRWRFAFRTGPYAHALFAVVAMLPPGGAVAYTTSTSSRCDIFDSGGSTIGSTTFDYGPNPKFGGIIPDAWPHLKVFTKSIDGVDPDTDYTGLFTTQGGRLQSACVFELGSLTEHNDGYLPQNLTAQSSVLDVYRQNLISMNNALWLSGGAQVMNWVADDGNTSGPITTTSATPTNIIDLTSTTVSAATPGWTLDMRGKARLNQAATGVPCKFKAYGKYNAIGIGHQPRLDLLDSTGTIIASISFTTTASWREVDILLPATVDKYDLQFSGDAGALTLSLHAVGIYELG